MKKTSKYVIGAGVAAAVATGIFSYFTQHPKGKKLAKQGQKYIADMTHQVAKKAEKIRTLSEAAYGRIVDEVIEEYQEQKKISTANGVELANQLKKEWKAVKRELKKK